jgi:hypothetical protein
VTFSSQAARGVCLVVLSAGAVDLAEFGPEGIETVVCHPEHAADGDSPTRHKEGVGLWGIAVAPCGKPLKQSEAAGGQQGFGTPENPDKTRENRVASVLSHVAHVRLSAGPECEACGPTKAGREVVGG